MALINIIASAEKPVDWGSIHKRYKELPLIDIELFPIPKQSGFDQDCFGILVHRNFSSKERVVIQLNLLLALFELYDMTMTELYDGVILSETNLEKTILGLLR